MKTKVGKLRREIKMGAPMLSLEHYMRIHKVIFGQGWSNDSKLDGEITRNIRSWLMRLGVDVDALERK